MSDFENVAFFIFIRYECSGLIAHAQATITPRSIFYTEWNIASSPIKPGKQLPKTYLILNWRTRILSKMSGLENKSF